MEPVARAKFSASGIARMEVIKGPGLPKAAPDIASINDPDELRRIAQERRIAFHPSATVERMKRRLMGG